jgi:hypothetical protein
MSAHPYSAQPHMTQLCTAAAAAAGPAPADAAGHVEQSPTHLERVVSSHTRDEWETVQQVQQLIRKRVNSRSAAAAAARGAYGNLQQSASSRQHNSQEMQVTCSFTQVGEFFSNL